MQSRQSLPTGSHRPAIRLWPANNTRLTPDASAMPLASTVSYSSCCICARLIPRSMSMALAPSQSRSRCSSTRYSTPAGSGRAGPRAGGTWMHVQHSFGASATRTSRDKQQRQQQLHSWANASESTRCRHYSGLHVQPPLQVIASNNNKQAGKARFGAVLRRSAAAPQHNRCARGAGAAVRAPPRAATLGAARRRGAAPLCRRMPSQTPSPSM